MRGTEFSRHGRIRRRGRTAPPLAVAVGLLALCCCVSPAWSITVDGYANPADEWTDAEIHITDPAPEPPIPEAYDVTDVYLAGGWELNFRLDVYDPPIVFKRGVYLRLDFAIDEDPGAAYSISLNDGLGLPSNRIHMVRFDDWDNRGFFSKQYLGEGVFETGDLLEASFEWSLFPSGVLSEGKITLNRYWFVLESGRGTADDAGEGPIEGTLFDPPQAVPEPITLLSFALGCGLLARRMVRIRASEGKDGVGEVRTNAHAATNEAAP